MEQDTEIGSSTSKKVGAAVESSAADRTALFSCSTSTDGWNDCVDQFIKWGNEPGDAEDEFVPPSRKVLSIAAKFAIKYRNLGYAQPERVVPDGDGGVVFEIHNGKLHEFIHVWDDGSVEYYCLLGTKLRRRYSIG